jgi:transcriptional regulator with XRE-family HTH domain
MNGALIARRMTELGIRPERLAAELDCSMSTVLNMKRGKLVRLDLAIKAARILGVDLSDLVNSDSKRTGGRKSAS